MDWRSKIEGLRKDIQSRRNLVQCLDAAKALARELDLTTSERAAALHLLGLAHAKFRETQNACAALNQALDLFRSLGDARGLGEVYDTFGQVHASCGRLDLAAAGYAQSLAYKQSTGDLEGTAISIGNLGRLHLRAGRLREARECFELDLALARRLGDAIGIARMQIDLGTVAIDAGEYEMAERWLRDALGKASDAAAGQVFFAHKELARLALERGDTTAVESELDAASAALTDGHEPYLDTLLDVLRARSLIRRGEEQGLTMLAQCAHVLDEADLPDHEVSARLELARAFVAKGYFTAAEQQLYRARDRTRQHGLDRLAKHVEAAYLGLNIVTGADEERERFDPDAAEQRFAHGYHVLQRLGRGAFGETYKVYDPDAGDVRALKVLHLAHVFDATRRKRLLDSARQELLAVSGLRHPGIARVFALGEDANRSRYVVQEWIDGITLLEWIRPHENRTPAEARVCLAAIARSLAALHRAGTVHRDLKPTNVMLRGKSVRAPVLIDFGIASSEALPSEPGVVVGTWGYMAPEQIAGQASGGAADVYSLGILAREWLTGEPPRKPLGTLVIGATFAPAPLPSIATLCPQLPPELVLVLDAMTTNDLRARPSALDAASILDPTEGRDWR